MNLLLLSDDDFINPQQVKLTDRRFEHIKDIHQAAIGDTLTLGLINNKLGKGTIVEIDNNSVIIDLSLTDEPPPPLPVTLVLALPRPNMLKRSLQTCATMGVKKIILLNTARVEKSYWQSPQLSEEKINEHLRLGLEQAKDTIMPTVIIEKNFNDFVNNKLPTLSTRSLSLVAHPNSQLPCPTFIEQETTLLIGPEGGFLEKEIIKINEAGCSSIEIGQRILRVETAVPVILAKLFY